jgi:Flp pilus assembly protein TadG
MRTFVCKWARDWARRERGSAAAELALMLVPVTLFLFGIVNLCLMAYAQNQLNFAAEATARCMVVANNATTAGVTAPACTSTSTDLAYLKGFYKGPTADPTFETGSPVLQKCTSGNYQVIANANYVINAAWVSWTVPLKAKACFAY